MYAHANINTHTDLQKDYLQSIINSLMVVAIRHFPSFLVILYFLILLQICLSDI